MSAAQGVPTIWEKLGVALGIDTGLTPEEVAAIKAGEAHDLSVAEKDIVGLFKPILDQAETTGMGDLVSMLQGLLALLPGVTTVSGAVKIVETVLAAEAGPMQKQAQSLGQTMLTTLVSAALSALGKANLPAA